LEREIKIRIASPPLKKIEEELDRLAKTLGTEEQTDYYFDKENMELTKGDKALRLRMTDTRSELTYKGPRLSDKVKARAELSLMLEDPESMRKILLNLGYNIILIVKKRRKNYDYRGAVISLDRVEELGDFMEIEANALDDDGLISLTKELMKLLKVQGEFETRSYAQLLALKTGRSV